MGVWSRERAVFGIMAHVFQIDQVTKRKWIPSSPNAVKVSYYHDPARKTYRIIAIDSNAKVRKVCRPGICTCTFLYAELFCGVLDAYFLHDCIDLYKTITRVDS